MKVGCLTVICFLAVILGFSYPIFFAIPGAVILYAIISHYFKKIGDKYADSINAEIDAESSERLMGVFNEIMQKYESNDFVKTAFENTYDHFLNKAFSTNFPNRKELLSIYEKNIKNEVLSSHQKDFIDKVLCTLSNMEHPIDDEFKYVEEIISELNVSEDIRNNAYSRLNVIKKIAALRQNGLQPLEINDPITAKKICFYYDYIRIYKNHKKDGQTFFEFEKIGQIYILNDEIDIVADGGHKKIKFSNIISIDFEDGILQLTILNRATPLGLSSEESEYIYEILDRVRNQF
ncbi:hypothetical protein IKR20_07905 [bacterium]|nr:hypothetical protein [bacterium]